MQRLSFRKFEHMILPRFRQRINEAESTEDIRKIFTQSSVTILEKAFKDHQEVHDEDIIFKPGQRPYFSMSRRFFENEPSRSIWNYSDLQQTIGGLAETAMHRYKHLQKHRPKTNSKIRTGAFR